ncbi:hypothetical protein BDV25DRAFT_139639 [Aspergillus avenaceus]|uniref:F-box domain-containing protein n=1 Tax=Aspergillus avenaceus TaxID=36643 RepID=A0A5N6TX35_ASPAV|nr:hypothetical protein BDV25DRAFT_139639 [Aspergillus avenaceus]
MHHFCVICGVLIRRTSFTPGEVPKKELEWDQLLRVVQRHDPLDDTLLSGVGYINSDDRIVAPRYCYHTYRHPLALLDEVIIFYDDADALPWSFVFHEACWDLLLQKVSGSRQDPHRLATVLFNVLFCTPWSRYCYLLPGHDFGGAAQFQKPVGNPVKRMVDQGYEYMLAKPSQPRNMADVLATFSTKSHHLPEVPTIQRLSKSCDRFVRLPVEILYLILEILPTTDIRNLRAASKSIASMTYPASLPQRLWRSRFALDFEMGFARPADTSIHQNWRHGYFALKHTLADPLGLPALKNRHRIWSIISVNAPLFTGDMVEVALSGSFPTEALEIGSTECPSPNGPAVGQVITTQTSSDCRKYLRVGSRKLFERHLTMPLHTSTITRIRVSTVTFNSQEFVSGFCFEHLDASPLNPTVYRLGYDLPGSQVFLDIPHRHRIVGFEVAARANGIAGIRAVLEDDSFCYHSPWVGDTGNGEPSIAFGKLSLSKELGHISLVAWFDAFKLISLGISQHNHMKRGLWKPQHLWTPRIPVKMSTLLPDITTPPGQVFRPTLLMDFGGMHGQMLPRLTRIVAHVHDYLAPIVGLTFVYCDETKSHFGRQGLMEIASFINGPAGERVIGIMYNRVRTSGAIKFLQMHTNFGNALAFLPYEVQDVDPTSVSLITPTHPPQNLSGSVPQKQDCPPQTIQVPEGEHVIGFASTLEASNLSFQSFHLLCEGTSSTSLTNQPATRHHPLQAVDLSAELPEALGSYVIDERSNKCMRYTTAPLDNARAIYISKGSRGRPRHPEEISGLWIDYYGSRRPLIVGQWIAEGKHITLARGERITGVTVLVSRITKSSKGRYYLGRVAQISIATSLKTESYPSHNMLTGNHDILRFEESNLEALSHFSWVFNDAWDHPRVTLSPKVSSVRIFPWDPCGPMHFRPWIAPQKALWTAHGQADSITSITGYLGRQYPYAVTGLRVIYQSGAEREIGDVSGPIATQTIQFHSDETIQALELFRDHVGLIAMNFHTIKRETCNQVERALIDKPPTSIPRHNAGGTLYRYYIDISRSRLTDGYIKVANTESREQDLPHGDVVGFWGFQYAEEDLHIGLLFSTG